MRIERQVIVPIDSRGHCLGALCIAMRRPREFQKEEVELLITIGNQLGAFIENAQHYERERRITEELRISERKYREIFEHASDAIWLNDLEGAIAAANEAAAHLTGYTVQELTRMNLRQLLARKRLETAGRVRREIFEKGAVDRPYEQYLVRKDGNEVILRVTSSLIRAGGRPLAFLNIARDVTDEMRAQEEERRRIAREDTMQMLYALTRRVDNYLRANPDLAEREAQFLRQMHAQIGETGKSIQRFSQALRPPMLDESWGFCLQCAGGWARSSSAPTWGQT